VGALGLSRGTLKRLLDSCKAHPQAKYARCVTVIVRHAHPSDYGRVIGRVNTWWGGREMAPMLPRLFFVHFEGTSFVADDDDGQLAGFICGFVSQTSPDEAYIHFVGVAPEHRGTGLGRELYERFFAAARAEGRSIVRCVTSPANEGSLSFHRALGFEVERIAKDYDGPGEDRALLVKRLD
jgi:ribosomal protein S18 acetylase RimI-like enzyme